MPNILALFHGMKRSDLMHAKGQSKWRPSINLLLSPLPVPASPPARSLQANCNSSSDSVRRTHGVVSRDKSLIHQTSSTHTPSGWLNNCAWDYKLLREGRGGGSDARASIQLLLRHVTLTFTVKLQTLTFKCSSGESEWICSQWDLCSWEHTIKQTNDDIYTDERRNYKADTDLCSLLATGIKQTWGHCLNGSITTKNKTTMFWLLTDPFIFH